MLQKIPWIYILALLSLLFFIPKIKHKISNTEEYFGIAENQIRSYTRSSDVIIHSIHVKPGQAVKQGDTLMTFHPRNLYYKKEDLSAQSQLLAINKKADQFDLNQNLKQLETEKNRIITEYTTRLQKIDDAKKLADSLAYVVTQQRVSNTKYESEKNALLEMKNAELKIIDQKLLNIRAELSQKPDDTPVKLNVISNEVLRLQDQEKELTLIADMDGIIGQLDYRIGDPVNAYQSLIKIYSSHPTLVTSYISEQYLSSVTLKDEVEIQSVSNPSYKLIGKILNLGTRITSLPDRLKKNPELRIWGRELQIEIPLENQFIQGEKVKVVFPEL